MSENKTLDSELFAGSGMTHIGSSSKDKHGDAVNNFDSGVCMFHLNQISKQLDYFYSTLLLVMVWQM